jgi:hypothetical protein
MTNQTKQIQLISLNAQQRIDAHEQAKQIVIQKHGKRPTREQYYHSAVSKYPAWLTAIISITLLIALIAAFVISATHLNDIGQQTISEVVEHRASIVMVGASAVLLSELAALVFSLALVLAHDRASKIILYIGMIISTIIALVGNIQHASPNNPFSWVMAIAPPILVLGLGYVSKMFALEAIEARHAAKAAYEQALQEYKEATASPETSPLFRPAYINALREMLVLVNSKGRGKTERVTYMQTMTNHDWSVLVNDALNADEWYTETPAGITSGEYSQLEANAGLVQPMAIKSHQIESGANNPNFPKLATSQITPITIHSNGKSKGKNSITN